MDSWKISMCSMCAVTATVLMNVFPLRNAIVIWTWQLFIVGVNPLLLQVLATPGAVSAMATPVDYQW